MYYVLCNPLSANKQGAVLSQSLVSKLQDEELEFVDIRTVARYADFWKRIDLQNDTVILSGGDGTLNRFINANVDAPLPKNLFYFAAGSGNDFKHDVSPDSDALIPLHKYIEDLPTVTINGKNSRFINGIGFGIDGYCCEVGDEMKKKSDKPVNYTAIAIKGLLFGFKPANAKVTVDGVTTEYKKAWIAPTMKGKYYGGGMMVTPEQDRFDPEGTVSVALMYGTGKLKTLMVFPSIFKGEHVKHTEMVKIMKGHEITVEFDKPTALQIDGETVLGVTSYTVRTGKQAKKTEAAKEAAKE
ncbi:MAG: diacylglycerol kinase family protein [Ruminococcaceae bacterium]|nr:diacylglycerol kinase family protein [Oscillospiraceae bacterium]